MDAGGSGNSLAKLVPSPTWPSGNKSRATWPTTNRPGSTWPSTSKLGQGTSFYSGDESRSERVKEPPKPRPTPLDCGRNPFSSISRRIGVKIRFVAHVVLGSKVQQNATGRRGQFLLATTANRRVDVKGKNNNQPAEHLIKHFGREFMKFCGDWSSVALSGAHAFRFHLVLLFFSWLIVVCDFILCLPYRIRLKLSLLKRNGIDQPQECPYLVLAQYSGEDGGPPWWTVPIPNDFFAKRPSLAKREQLTINLPNDEQTTNNLPNLRQKWSRVFAHILLVPGPP